MKLGLALPYSDRVPRELILAMVKAADQLGYDSLWLPEVYGWDAFTALTEFACATERIQLGTGIINVFSRSPALIGQTAASLDAISGGRFRLGLGTSGHQVVEGWHGVRYEKPIQRLRETVEVVRSVLRRDRLDHQGEVFQLSGRLKLMTHPIRDRIPIYLATLTPAGVELAGEIADGWIPIFYSPAHFDTVFRPQLERGAQRAGRSLEDLSICVFQQVVVSDDIAAARDAVRPHLALYVGGMGSRQKNYYNRLFHAYGLGGEATRIQDLYLDGRHRDAAAAISDEMVDLVTIAGPSAECRRRLQALAESGVGEVAMILQVPGDDIEAMRSALQELAPAGTAA
ncbi:MAG TPA: LLM class F420-dependent oxidoreductase [Candidatus Dormibacteraeota bacterium]|nr:LLM class F420-dependent oxidoreductase [Candidatus Dormibacteraeota bacterium]